MFRGIPLAVLAFSFMSQPVLSQNTDATISLGEEVTAGAPANNTYIKEEFGDWSTKCLVSEDGNDPCQIFQLVRDAEGSPVAEISLFPLPDGGRAVAGGTIATPLETLLTQQVTMSVDGGTAKRYPFTYCTAQGCFARIGLTEVDLDAFKRGTDAVITIVPLTNPNASVNLSVSLKGFTAGFNALAK